MGSRTTSPETALELVDIFLVTAFEGGKYAPRLDILEEVEREVYGILKGKYGCGE